MFVCVCAYMPLFVPLRDSSLQKLHFCAFLFFFYTDWFNFSNGPRQKCPADRFLRKYKDSLVFGSVVVRRVSPLLLV